MSRKSIAANQRILRRGTFRIPRHILCRQRTARLDQKIHQIPVKQACLHASVFRNEAQLIDRGICPLAADKRQGSTCWKHLSNRLHSAASGASRRAFAFALSSAISWLARAIGLVR